MGAGGLTAGSGFAAPQVPTVIQRAVRGTGACLVILGLLQVRCYSTALGPGGVTLFNTMAMIHPRQTLPFPGKRCSLSQLRLGIVWRVNPLQPARVE